MNRQDRSRSKQLSKLSSKRGGRATNQDDDFMAFASTMTDLTVEAQTAIEQRGGAGPGFEKFNSTNSNPLRPHAPSFRRGNSSRAAAADRDSSQSFQRVQSIQEEPEDDVSPASISSLRPKPSVQASPVISEAASPKLSRKNSESTAASPTIARKSSKAAIAPKVQKVQLSVTEGKLTVDAAYKEGPKLDPASGSGIMLSLSGTEDQINKALRTLRYTAPNNRASSKP